MYAFICRANIMPLASLSWLCGRKLKKKGKIIFFIQKSNISTRKWKNIELNAYYCIIMLIKYETKLPKRGVHSFESTHLHLEYKGKSREL